MQRRAACKDLEGSGREGCGPHGRTRGAGGLDGCCISFSAALRAWLRLYLLAAACDDTWIAGALSNCPTAITSLVEEMGGLRQNQHLFSCRIDEHSFAYISSWPWSDQHHVSVRFGVHHLGGTQVEILTHKILIKRQKRYELRPAFTGAAFTPQESNVKMRVILQQSQCLQAAIAGGSNNCNSLERRGRHRRHRLLRGRLTLVIDPVASPWAL